MNVKLTAGHLTLRFLFSEHAGAVPLYLCIKIRDHGIKEAHKTRFPISVWRWVSRIPWQAEAFWIMRSPRCPGTHLRPLWGSIMCETKLLFLVEAWTGRKRWASELGLMYCKLGGMDTDLPSPLGIWKAMNCRIGWKWGQVPFGRHCDTADEKGGRVQFSLEVRGWDPQAAS